VIWCYMYCRQHFTEKRKAWSQGTPEKSHIGHCTHTSEKY
jgi:hypothetical protein